MSKVKAILLAVVSVAVFLVLYDIMAIILAIVTALFLEIPILSQFLYMITEGSSFVLTWFVQIACYFCAFVATNKIQEWTMKDLNTQRLCAKITAVALAIIIVVYSIIYPKESTITYIILGLVTAWAFWSKTPKE